MTEDKQAITNFMLGQIQQVRSIKSHLAKMAAEELELVVDRYSNGEITLEEMVSRYEQVAHGMTILGFKSMGVSL